MSSIDINPIDGLIVGDQAFADLAKKHADSTLPADTAALTAPVMPGIGGAIPRLTAKLKMSYIDSVKNGCKVNFGYQQVNMIHATEITGAIDEWLNSGVLMQTSIVLPGMFRTLNAGVSLTPVIAQGPGTVATTTPAPLLASIKQSLDSYVLDGTSGDSTYEQLADKLGLEMATAILAYSKTAVLACIIKVVHPFLTSGIIPNIAPMGSPEKISKGEMGLGTGTGGTALGLVGLEPHVPTLAAAIATAYKNRVISGSEAGVDPIVVAQVWASEMANAILVFFKKSIPTTAVVFLGGKGGGFASISMMMVGGVPSKTMPPPVTVPGATSIAAGIIK